MPLRAITLLSLLFAAFPPTASAQESPPLPEALQSLIEAAKRGDAEAQRILDAAVRWSGSAARQETATAPELLSPKEVLQLFIGAWDTESRWIPAEDPAQAVSGRQRTVRRWSAGGTFMVELEAREASRERGGQEIAEGVPGEFFWVLTHDPVLKNYRSVVLTPNFSSRLYGRWDDETQTMTWTGQSDQGETIRGVHRVLDADHHTWTLRMSRDGQRIAEHRGVHRRRSEPAASTDEGRNTQADRGAQTSAEQRTPAQLAKPAALAAEILGRLAARLQEDDRG